MRTARVPDADGAVAPVVSQSLRSVTIATAQPTMSRDQANTPPSAASELPSLIHLDREACANLSASESREWLVTNGRGSFASGTVAGLLTRRYHGFLIAALDPPRQRTLLVTKLDEIASCSGQTFSLAANRWADGTLDPQGYLLLDAFRLEGAIPVWTYSFADAQLEKRICMRHGANTTYVEYRLTRAAAPVELALKVLVNYRDFHGATHAADWQMRVEPFNADGIRVTAFAGAIPFYIRSAAASAELASEWYRNFDLAAERERGLDASEDHLHAATFRVTLRAGQSVSLVLSTDASANLDAAAALAAEQSRVRDLLVRRQSARARKVPDSVAAAPPDPDWIRQLVLAADQFLLEPPSSGGDSPGLIAGYPWFGVWSRDTMVALPGLALATGRPEIARSMLRRFAGLTNGGMLPNFIPESGDAVEYNSVDASLWFVEAVRQYLDSTRDLDFARELFPSLVKITSAYAKGTRFAIHADPADGLLFAGVPSTADAPATQLTWMDARAAGRAVTSRIGKPVEINALWINALETLSRFAQQLNLPDDGISAFTAHARKSFQRFWNASRNCCFDVLDGPEGNDASLRPNQIFAVSLPVNVLDAAQQRAVVEACAKNVLTPYGLRSLAPGEPGYSPRYSGTQDERAAAYHQGTIWAWLLGPFALAHFRVFSNSAAALHLFDAIPGHLAEAGLGSVSEVFDAEPPFTPRGCPAQAWSVAEILRAWTSLASSPAPASRIRSE